MFLVPLYRELVGRTQRMAGVALVAVGATTLACYLPARRAADAGPMRSLRSDGQADSEGTPACPT